MARRRQTVIVLFTAAIVAFSATAAIATASVGSSRTLSGYEMSYVARGSQVGQPGPCTQWYFLYRCLDGPDCPQLAQPDCNGPSLVCCDRANWTGALCNSDKKPWTVEGGTPDFGRGPLYGCGSYRNNAVCAWTGTTCICDGGVSDMLGLCNSFTCPGAYSGCTPVP
jgi:hypothetical protein